MPYYNLAIPYYTSAFFLNKILTRYFLSVEGSHKVGVNGVSDYHTFKGLTVNGTGSDQNVFLNRKAWYLSFCLETNWENTAFIHVDFFFLIGWVTLQSCCGMTFVLWAVPYTVI